MLTAPDAHAIVERVNHGKYGPTLNEIGQKIAEAAHMGRTSVCVKLDANSGRFWVKEKLCMLGYTVRNTTTLELEISW
jgi:hypothetical protein